MCKWNRLKKCKLIFSNLMSGKVGDVFICIWRISDLFQSHTWFDKGSIMLTFFHEVMQPDSNGVIAVRKHWCPTKSHLIDRANKDRCHISPQWGKENNLQTLVGQVFGPRPLSPFFDDSVGERHTARWHGRISGFTEENLHTFSGFWDGVWNSHRNENRNRNRNTSFISHKGQKKPCPDIYTAHFTDTAHYSLYTAFCCL